MKRIEIDWNILDGMLSVGASMKQCADYLDCSHDTIERRIMETHGLKFKDYRDKKLAGTKIKLQQKAIDSAFKGNTTMLIFCLKNLCGWTDKVETENTHKGEAVNITYKLKEVA